MSRPIVHVFPDSVFLPLIAELFETVAPGENEFLMYAGKGDAARHCVPASGELVDVGRGDEATARISAEVANGSIAIFHSVGPFTAPLLASAPSSTLCVWSGWGGDYYGSDRSMNDGLLEPLTQQYEARQIVLDGNRDRARRDPEVVKQLAEAARAAAVFSAPIPNDLRVFKRHFRGFHGKYRQLNYATVEDSFAPSATEIVGDDILLGNSATLPNNHLDVLELLAHANTDGRRIVTPLSYGDPRYADAVTTRGRELFGSDFVEIRDFLPLPEYKSLVAGCSVQIMGHRRQQGLGNIGIGLWSGARVVLSEASPATAFFRKRGASITTLREVSRRGLPSGRMSARELEASRRMLTRFWGRETVLKNIAELLKLGRRVAAREARPTKWR